MKTISKKHVLAGLLMAAAVVPATSDAFIPSLISKIRDERLLKIGAFIVLLSTKIEQLFKIERTIFDNREHNYDIIRCTTNPESSIRTSYRTLFKEKYIGGKFGKLVSSKPIKESIEISCPKGLRYGSSEACLSCPLFSKKIVDEVPLKQ